MARKNLANADDSEFLRAEKEPTVQAAEQLGAVVPDEPGQQVGGEEYEPVRVPRPQRPPPPRRLMHAVLVQHYWALNLDHGGTVAAGDRRSFRARGFCDEPRNGIEAAMPRPQLLQSSRRPAREDEEGSRAAALLLAPTRWRCSLLELDAAQLFLLLQWSGRVGVASRLARFAALNRAGAALAVAHWSRASGPSDARDRMAALY